MKVNGLIQNRWLLGAKIGQGSFGDIYEAWDNQKNETVAVKLEDAESRHPQLIYEAKLLQYLYDDNGLPVVLWYGTISHYNVMVMQLLGPSLEKMFNYCNRRFSIQSCILLGEQMLDRIQYVHDKNFLHRDIKPDNFLLDKNPNSKKLFLIDFGLAKRYRNSQTLKHIEYRDGRSLTGTARYASINSHRGIEPSRRDDLESIGYLIMYFLRGNLPWQGLQSSDVNDRYKRIKEVKVETPVQQLVLGFPEQLAEYFNYVKGLKFEADPDYAYLREVFKKIMITQGISNDQVYDWNLLNYGSRRGLSQPKAMKGARQGSRQARKTLKNIEMRPRRAKSTLDINNSNDLNGSKKNCTIF